jgi:probable F420-dependent oxidoreductase
VSILGAGVGVGITLPVQAQTTLAAEPWEASAGPADLLHIAAAADRLGFFSVSVSDHVVIPRDRVETMSATWYDPVAVLGAVAACTSRVHLFTRALILPFRAPLLAAKSAVTLDALSGGRLILGVGAGHVREEFDAVGVDFTRRGALLDQAIDVITAALLDEYPEIETKDWTVRDLAVGPRPARSPRPPIWVGGSSGPALRRAARRADGWFPQVADPELFERSVAEIRALREELRPGEPIEIGANSVPIYLGSASWDYGSRTLAGPPARIAEFLNTLVAAGGQHLQVPFRSRSCTELEDELELFAAEVLPALTGGSPHAG